MRRLVAIVVIAVVGYFVLGLAIALVKMPGTFICPDYHGPAGFVALDESCRPLAGLGERLRFIGSVVPAWPGLVAEEGIGPRVGL